MTKQTIKTLNISLMFVLVALVVALISVNNAKADDFAEAQIEQELNEIEASMFVEESVVDQDFFTEEEYNRLPAHTAGEKINKAPAPFENSDIKRTLKDGKVQKFDGDKYMIVRRRKYKKQEPKVIEKKVVKYKNRISLLGGRAPDGDISQEGNKIFTEHDLTLGLQYQRLMNDRLSIGIQVQTNESVLGSVGYDF